MDIGCGLVFGALALKRNFSPAKIVATDLDPRMIASAKKNVTDPSIFFEFADATKLSYENAGFDAVFEYGAIHHIPGPEWKTCLDEIYRVLVPKGRVFIYDNSIESFTTIFGRIIRLISCHPYDSMYKRSEFIDYMKLIGFNIIKEVSLGRYFVIIAEKNG